MNTELFSWISCGLRECCEHQKPTQHFRTRADRFEDHLISPNIVNHLCHHSVSSWTCSYLNHIWNIGQSFSERWYKTLCHILFWSRLDQLLPKLIISTRHKKVGRNRRPSCFPSLSSWWFLDVAILDPILVSQQRHVHNGLNHIFMGFNVSDLNHSPTPFVVRKCQPCQYAWFCAFEILLCSDSHEFLKTNQFLLCWGPEFLDEVEDGQGGTLIPQLVGCTPHYARRRSHA